jgi:hypothetical protein
VNGTRRRPAGSILSLALLLVTVLALCVGALATAPAVAATTAPPPTEEPSVTANPFLPEEQNIGACIGALERPGCGSEERGGWRQTLVFALVGVGMAFVFTMVAREVRRSRRQQESTSHEP